MKEVKKCSISGIAFTLDADAYALLSRYLDSLKATYAETAEGGEIRAQKNPRKPQQIKKEHEGTFNIVINPIRIELRQSTEKHNIKDPYILEVVKYIESHYSSDLTIESLLANIPLSRRNFEVKFKNALNTSIYQYILNCRCNHLADLLLTTDRPLADLAMEVGFTDYNNIARIFKKFKGCSPIEYRQKKTRQR